MTELTKALDNDGLVDNKKPYKLEVKDGELYINGTKQTKQISKKYRKFYKDDNYTINNDGDEPTPNLTFNDAPKEVPKTVGPNPDSKEPKFDRAEYQKELKMMYQLIDGLHKDGVIDKNKPYEVNIKNGELYIDRKKQAKEVSDKFRPFFWRDNYGFMND